MGVQDSMTLDSPLSPLQKENNDIDDASLSVLLQGANSKLCKLKSYNSCSNLNRPKLKIKIKN
jgi:hypothetical protein